MTLAAILLTLKKIGFFIVDNWRLIIICLAVLIVMVVGFIAFRPKPAKLDEAQIEKAKQAIATADRQRMEEVLIESKVQEKKIDENLSNAKAATINAVKEVRSEVRQMTNEELAAELERKMSQ